MFAVFYGLDWIATVPPTVRLAASTFGPERAGVAFGWIFAAHKIGAAVAAFGGGLSRTYLGAYTPGFYVAGAACVVAALSVWMIGRKPRAGPGAGAGLNVQASRRFAASYSRASFSMKAAAGPTCLTAPMP